MGIIIFTKKEAQLKEVFPKSAKFLPPDFSGHSPSSDDVAYLDVSAFSEEEIKKALSQFKKSCGDASWGIIDPKGSVKDPALLFFEGACDYLGQSFIKEGKALDAKRVKEVLQWRKHLGVSGEGAPAESASKEASSGKEKGKAAKGKDTGAGFLKTGVKLPPEGTFVSWKKIAAGKAMPFYLLYCSLQGKVPLDDRFEPKVLAQIHKRFIVVMENNFDCADGLFWMDSGQDCLFLLPPKVKCVEEAIKSCIKMIVSAPLIVYESLDISIPVNFVFALHYGEVNYRPPGKTGTVVSDAINFIFHLGKKKAQPGRLTDRKSVV
jgi:hypothetical protein